jgi:2-haloacid dehalogenase
MNVKALVFDVFGTLVDWRTGIARAASEVLPPHVAVGAFADSWRRRYQPSLEPIRAGRRPWCDLDVLHAESLQGVIEELGLPALDAAQERRLVLGWHSLDAWPDVVPGLHRLRERFILAPVSNGHIALSVALARHNALHWDAILGAEIARDYKPKPSVYLGAVEALKLTPEEVMMVACHSQDLAAAAACGLRTAHVARPDEKGPGLGEAGPTVPVDIVAGDVVDLAAQLHRLVPV